MITLGKKTSPKGFLASNWDVGNFKNLGNSLEILWEFFGKKKNRIFECERNLCMYQDFGLMKREENLNL